MSEVPVPVAPAQEKFWSSAELQALSTAELKAMNNDRAARGLKKLTRNAKYYKSKSSGGKGKKYARSYATKKSYTRRGGGGGGYRRGGQSIVYPNVISGQGAYFLGGSIGYDSEKGWTGGAKGYFTDNTPILGGVGDYKIRSNTLAPLSMGTSPPRIINSGNGQYTIINHREALGDFISPVDGGGGGTVPTPFHLVSHILNPGNPALFPWLSQVAANYQEYRFNGLMIELKTLSSDFAEGMSLGSMFMATNYNVGMDPPTTKAELENMEFSSSCKPSTSLCHYVECDPNLTVNDGHLYVAYNGFYGSLFQDTTDPRFYDMGTIHLGCQGIPVAGASIAELWVSYEIILFKPTIPPKLVEPNNQTWWFSIFTGVSTNVPLGTSGALGPGYGYLNDSMTFNVGNQQISLPKIPTCWLIIYDSQSEAAVTTTQAPPTITDSGTGQVNINVVSPWFGTGGYLNKYEIVGSAPIQTATTSDIHFVQIVSVIPDYTSDNTPAIQFTGGTVTGTVMASVVIAPINLDFTQDDYALRKQVKREMTKVFTAKPKKLEDDPRRKLLEAMRSKPITQ